MTRWADRQLRILASETGSEEIAALAGATIMGERAIDGGFTIGAKQSSGPGTSRLMPTRDGRWFALTIPRPVDRELLPALFGDASLDIHDQDAIARAVAAQDCSVLLEIGRALGLPVATADEQPVSEAVTVVATGPRCQRASGARPLVIDMSAIRAGPLIGHLLWLAGADVVKVESSTRPDEMREVNPGIFDLINQGKANIVVDFYDDAEKAALIDLIRRADIVIESSRPRALRQLGIDAEALIGEVPGLVWLSVTGHGATGEAENWTGFGHECGVSGGLSRALAEVTGEVGYVGDAIADPLTGILATLAGWRAFKDGQACRIGIALSAVVALAMREERAHDANAFEDELRAWGAAVGKPFPAIERRRIVAPVHPQGSDTQVWLGTRARC